MGARRRSTWARGGIGVSAPTLPCATQIPISGPRTPFFFASRFPALGNNFVSVSRSRCVRRSVCLPFTERVPARRKRRKPSEKQRFLKNRQTTHLSSHLLRCSADSSRIGVFPWIWRRLLRAGTRSANSKKIGRLKYLGRKQRKRCVRGPELRMARGGGGASERDWNLPPSRDLQDMQKSHTNANTTHADTKPTTLPLTPNQLLYHSK